MIDILLPLIAFILIISIIVTVHEFGHYWAGRCFGLIATKFSIGFGKRLVFWKDKKGTSWQIAPVLLGGYVQFPGDDKQPIPLGATTLSSLPRWQKALVVVAGPAINFVLAGLIFIGIAYFYGYPTGQPLITSVDAHSPAEEAGLKTGDLITHFNGQKVTTATEVSQQIMLYPGRQMSLQFERDEITTSVNVSLESQEYDDGMGNIAEIGYLGVEMPRAFERAPDLITAVRQGVRDGLFMAYAQLTSVKQIAQGERAITELSGPVRIAKISAHTLSLGLLPFLYLTAVLSIGVGIINLLPIPTLDGGHLAIYAIEAVIGRDLPDQIAQHLLRAGLALIICIAVLGITLDFIALR